MFVSFWQMAFWQNRSISLVDMYIDNSEPTENVGQIHFSLEYDFQNTTLILKIMQVHTHTHTQSYFCLVVVVVVTFNIPRLPTFATIAWRQSTFGRYQFAACIIESLIQVVSIWKRSFGYSGRETNDKNKEIACSNQIELREQTDKPAARKRIMQKCLICPSCVRCIRPSEMYSTSNRCECPKGVLVDLFLPIGLRGGHSSSSWPLLLLLSSWIRDRILDWMWKDVVFHLVSIPFFFFFFFILPSVQFNSSR